MRILIVRLGSMGDIVHAIPAAAALRAALPDATLDWLVDWRHRELLGYVPIVDRTVVLEAPGGVRSWLQAIRQMRARRYDVAVDFQGLLKSAVLARASGSRRVAGFGSRYLREAAARPFYTEVGAGTDDTHVIAKNLALAAAVGASSSEVRFPLAPPASGIVAGLERAGGASEPFALLNPGAAWPNKRWPPERFGRVASLLRTRFGVRSIVAWGPGEQDIADRVVESSGGAASLAPKTTIGDLIHLVRAARLMVSGDTGPLHLAAASGTPIVGIYGPTNPARNGPFAPDDVTVSRFPACHCHHLRRCRIADWCIGQITVDEVMAAVIRRMESSRGR
jgi:lipopolysaccharide heptosyltransferase I